MKRTVEEEQLAEITEINAAAAVAVGAAVPPSAKRALSRRTVVAALPPLITNTNIMPTVRPADSLALIALQVHNVVRPHRAFGDAEAQATWTNRMTRLLELEQRRRSFTILDLFQQSILALTGERLTGRGACAPRYEQAQADMWELVMEPRGTAGRGNCLAYTNALAAVADHFGLFGTHVRFGSTPSHAFLLARTLVTDDWRVVESTQLESYSAVFAEHVTSNPNYGFGEYGIISNPNEFRLMLFNETGGRVGNAPEDEKATAFLAAARGGGRGRGERLFEKMVQLESQREEVKQTVRLAIAESQRYTMRLLSEDDPHFGKFWEDKIIVLLHDLVPIDDTGTRQWDRQVTRLSVSYITSIRRTIVALVQNRLIRGYYADVGRMLKQLMEWMKRELLQPDARSYELDQSGRLIDWTFWALDQYLLPPDLVLQWQPSAQARFGAGTGEDYMRLRNRLQSDTAVRAAFTEFRDTEWTPLHQFIQGVVGKVEWFEEPGPPLLLYHQQPPLSSRSRTRKLSSDVMK